ncbi:MAG: hypothetical protein E4G99_10175 [Anaerolineales bacterium]|nr:MAG: hypothetical protein E4G99_10175 [Anaerolineales bacterium]
MSEIYLPSVTHVIAMTTIRRERVLPVPGSIAVRVTEKVQASDVVAEAEIEPKHFYLDIARGLGIDVREVGRYLTRQQGDRVEAGDVIAGPVGLTRRTVRAPADGRIAAIHHGRVLLETRGELFQLRAGFPGVVVSSDGAQIVVVETTGSLVQGAWGNGKTDYGVMRVVGDGPAAHLSTNQLDVNLRGAVLVAGVCDHPAPLHQATELSVRGVILGGMSAELIPLARRLPFPILLTEGFGDRAINTPAFALFMSHVGREVTIDAGTEWPQPGQRPEVVIPLSTTRSVSLPEEVIALKPGVRVRILSEPNLGEVGVIKSILKQAVIYKSGIRAKSASVEIEGIGTTNVPLANIEILQ